ncbi:MAG: aldehyde dehydrogenase family protein [Euryarchaeota archaeon]|nr:aldehyde dehydrogenase family protein [Euryarchaeota archaeon]
MPQGRLVILNPADRRRKVGEAPIASPEDVKRAVDAAGGGFECWSSVPMRERGKALSKIADAFEAEGDALARSLVDEVGKPLKEARGEVAGSIGVLRYYSAIEFDGRTVAREEGENVTFYTHQPLGVAALILPWNYPLLVMSWKLAPALLAGNAAIVKPSEYTPLTNLLATKIVANHLPNGAVQIICGGDSVGEALSSHRKVAMVSLTGSAATGPKLLRQAAGRMARVTLELGGNDPAIVMPDADLSKRFESLFWSAFRNAGQVCIAVKRLYVHEKIYDEVVRRFAGRADALRLGNGMDEATDMGPVNNGAQLRKVSRLVSMAQKDGGKTVRGGRRPGGALAHGLFYDPAIVTGLGNDASLVQEEQFGPALPIIPFGKADDAVEMANDCGLALGASVWSEDRKRALGIAERLDAGVAWVNAHMALDNAAPFGGFKGSGLGRELGMAGLMEYSAPKTYIIK